MRAGPSIGLVWAQAANGVIGIEGGLPWRLPEDLEQFKRLTMGATVIMGRVTWESLPASVRPLPGRRNVVLTRDTGYVASGADVVRSLDDAVVAVSGDVWVIGGASVYRQAMPLADRLVVTEIDKRFAGDAVAPEIGAQWRLDAREPSTGWRQSASGLRFAVSSYLRSAERPPGS